MIIDLDEYIQEAFKEYWVGDEVLKNPEKMKAQLFKNLNDQLGGFWSGHSAYLIMVNYGFLIDAKHKPRKPKNLTVLGRVFVRSYKLEQMIK